MDNKINEIRRKISALRLEMLTLEDTIRLQVNRDEDCSETAILKALIFLRISLILLSMATSKRVDLLP